jgi:hypothetical protein
VALIPLTGAGSLGVRLGHMMGRAGNILALLGGNATAAVTENLPAQIITTVTPDYANGTPAPQCISNLIQALFQYQQSGLSFVSTLQQDTIFTIQFMYGVAYLGISADAPLSTFQSIPLGQALQGLYNQMVLNTQTVQAPTVAAGAQTNVGTPVGNGIAVVSLFNGLGNGLALVIPETLTIACTADSYTGGRVAGNEGITISGQTAQPKTSPLWPGGSGVTQQLNAVNGAANNSQGNVLQNSDFNTFTTANVPDNWTIAVGAAGTQVVDAGSGHSYTPGNTHSLSFVGDSATLTTITQKFNTTPVATVGAGGTAFSLVTYPDNVLHFCMFMAVNATQAGLQLNVDLYDGSAIVKNDAGVNQVVNLNLGSLSTSFVGFTGAFQLPKSIPATLYIRVRVVVGHELATGKTLYIGRMSLAVARTSSIVPPNGTGQMVQGIYPGGPFVTFHSGSIPVVNGLMPDQWTIAMTNNYSTSGTGLFQQYLERWCSLSTLGLQLPTVVGGGATILDSVIA